MWGCLRFLLWPGTGSQERGHLAAQMVSCSFPRGGWHWVLRGQMSPFLHTLSRQIASWLSGWLTVKFHECALLGIFGALHASTWPLAPFYLCLDDTRPLQAGGQSEVPLLSTVALRLPPHPASISRSNRLLTTIHSKQRCSDVPPKRQA